MDRSSKNHTSRSDVMPSPASTYPQAIKLAWKKYRNLWKFQEVPARQLLLKEGEICRRLYLIDKGAVRNWFAHEGREISFQFFFEGDVVSASESFRKQLPSPFSIETMEPSTLRWLNAEDFQQIRKDPDLYDHMIGRAADKQAEFMLHFFSYLRDTPRQRYEHLLKERPELIRRVPLQYIATYLGITQVSLSRIRGRVQ